MSELQRGFNKLLNKPVDLNILLQDLENLTKIVKRIHEHDPIFYLFKMQNRVNILKWNDYFLLLKLNIKNASHKRILDTRNACFGDQNRFNIAIKSFPSFLAWQTTTIFARIMKGITYS